MWRESDNDRNEKKVCKRDFFRKTVYYTIKEFTNICLLPKNLEIPLDLKAESLVKMTSKE